MRAIALAAIAAIAIAACGSDDASDEPAGSAADLAVASDGCPPLEGADQQRQEFDRVGSIDAFVRVPLFDGSRGS